MFAVIMEQPSESLDPFDEVPITYGFAGPFESREIAEETASSAIANGCPSAFVVTRSGKWDNVIGEGFERAVSFAKSMIK